MHLSSSIQSMFELFFLTKIKFVVVYLKSKSREE